jgi:hypothetical protein
MKGSLLSFLGKTTLILSAFAIMIYTLAGCGASFNSAAEKDVTGSSAPVVSCIADPTSMTSGDSAAISTRAISPLGLPLTYSYNTTGGSLTSQGQSATLNTEGVSGNVAVTCKVVDSKGNTASSIAVLVVAPDVSSSPTASCSANPSTLSAGSSATITATARSPQERPLAYSWSASAGTISGNGNIAIIKTTDATVGSITVTCRVADDQGRSASATTAVAVHVPPSPGPTVSCSANPSIINQGSTTVITAVGSSPKGLPLSYSYSSSAGSIGSTSNTATLETTGTSAGIVTVTCTVDQQGGGTASATSNVLLQSLNGEQAHTAFQFTDSVGVNVHLAYDDTVYATQFPRIMQSMINLGVKHYRDGLNQYAPSFQYEHAELLGKSGIKADWIMDIHNSASDINSAQKNAPDATAAFEGPNEDDAETGAPIRAFMQLLHNTVHGNPATASMPIIGPSFKQPSSSAAQGNLGSLTNFGNMHDYFGNFNPETTPYGAGFYNCGGYGGIHFDICLAQIISGGEAVVSTETGYESGTGLSDVIIGRYEVRTLFESLRLDVNRTYLYELIDDPSGNWGLLTGGFAPRPAYTAIHNVLSLLKDGNFAQPGKLNYALAGETQNVHHVLLQKRDGTFYLAIWIGAQSADPNNPSTIYPVAPQNLTLTASTSIGSATTYVLDDRGNMTSTSGELTNGSFPIVVTDRVTLIALSPGRSH